MRVLIDRQYKLDKKQPTGETLRAVAAAFVAAGMADLGVRLTASDLPVPGRASTAARALKRFPDLWPFVQRRTMPGAMQETMLLTNVGADGEARSDVPLPWETVLAIADGVPRSFPFQMFTVQFRPPEFGQVDWPGGVMQHLGPGIVVNDNWWISGRKRSLRATVLVEGNGGLGEPDPRVSAALAHFGKPTSTEQTIVDTAPSGMTLPMSRLSPVHGDLAAIHARYRSDLSDVIARANMPHALSDNDPGAHAGYGSGPLKPALVAEFKPRGFSCKGGSGMFHLRRKTEMNHTVQLELDVGTWSRSVTAMFSVQGPGFNTTLFIPAAPGANRGQFDIGDTARWEKIVANLGALVDELERTYVREIAEAAGPAPDWFEPEK